MSSAIIIIVFDEICYKNPWCSYTYVANYIYNYVSYILLWLSEQKLAKYTLLIFPFQCFITFFGKGALSYNLQH